MVYKSSKFIERIDPQIGFRQHIHGKLTLISFLLYLSFQFFRILNLISHIIVSSFNQLDLPVYETYDKLRTNLLKAIHECSEGFGFA